MNLAERPAEPPAGTDPVTVLNEMMVGTLCERMNMRELDEASGVIVMPVEGNTQPFGLLHGGASIALAESVGSFCATLQARSVYGPGAYAVGTSISATHHRSVRAGVVTARARALHLGRRLATHAVEVTREDGVLLSSVSVTNMLMAPE
jgi:uncharacterized protein (TIGR00369 family)